MNYILSTGPDKKEFLKKQGVKTHRFLFNLQLRKLRARSFSTVYLSYYTLGEVKGSVFHLKKNYQYRLFEKFLNRPL